MPKLVKYISHGDLPDGGYRHEKFFAESLSKHLQLPFVEKRKWKLYKGFYNIFLQVWGMMQSNASHNVVAARLGVLSWFRNILTSNNSYVIVHDYDKNRYNSIYLRCYYPFLFLVFRLFKPKRFKLVVISNYWVEYFNSRKGIAMDNIVLFPNLINANAVVARRSNDTEKWIHLGQYSSKNSEDIFAIAKELSSVGYYCFFSSLNKDLVMNGVDYSIEYFKTYESYLDKVAKCKFTLAFSRFHEGWNRVVHESALLETPVIGYKMGGMKSLIEESNNILVDHWREALDIVNSNFKYDCSEEFTSRYDISKAEYYLVQSKL